MHTTPPKQFDSQCIFTIIGEFIHNHDNSSTGDVTSYKEFMWSFKRYYGDSNLLHLSNVGVFSWSGIVGLPFNLLVSSSPP